MEHLFITTGGSLTDHDIVPYIATTEYERISLVEYVETQWPSNTVGWERETTEKNILSKLQTWFFFGLFRQVIGDYFVPDEYILAKTQDDGSIEKTVNTTTLVPALDAWVEFARSKLKKEDHLPTIEKCFSHLSPGSNFSANYLLGRTECDRRISISIRSAGSLLCQAVRKAFGFEHINIGLSPSLSHLSIIDLSIMQSNGWCPFEITRCWPQLCLQSQMMLRTAPKYGSANHSICTSQICRYAQIDKKTFSSKHTTPDCRCTMWVADTLEVARIVEGGRIPLLKISRCQKMAPNNNQLLSRDFDNPEFSLLSADSSTPYVAISHVWAQGLGNPHQNALPRCQLIRLASNVDDFYNKQSPSSENESCPVNGADDVLSAQLIHDLSLPGVCKSETLPEAGDMFLWLDTLCCPVEPIEIRRLAISRMSDVYQDAADVVVLDDCLEEIASKSLRMQEVAMYICTSTWARRAWTLQEGVLSTRLWFRFKDQYLRIDLLIHCLLQQNEKLPLVAFQANANFGAMLRHLNGGLCIDSDPNGRDEWGLRQVARAFSSRSLSVLTDEPLCLLNLVSITRGTPPMLDEGQQAHDMSRFWDVCRDRDLFPNPDIIFNELPRMPLKGYRWAPASLLVDVHGVDRGIFLSMEDSPQGPVAASQANDRRGYVAFHDGWILAANSQRPFRAHVLRQFSAKTPDIKSILLYDTISSEWYRVGLRSQQDSMPIDLIQDDTRIAAIIQKSSIKRGSTRKLYLNALFVSVAESGTDFHYVNTCGQAAVASVNEKLSTLLHMLVADPIVEDANMSADLIELATDAYNGNGVPRHHLEEDSHRRVKRMIRETSQRFREGQYLQIAEHVSGKEFRWIVD